MTFVTVIIQCSELIHSNARYQSNKNLLSRLEKLLSWQSLTIHQQSKYLAKIDNSYIINKVMRQSTMSPKSFHLWIVRIVPALLDIGQYDFVILFCNVLIRHVNHKQNYWSFMYVEYYVHIICTILYEIVKRCKTN